jgi:hypothetical protein
MKFQESLDKLRVAQVVAEVGKVIVEKLEEQVEKDKKKGKLYRKYLYG